MNLIIPKALKSLLPVVTGMLLISPTNLTAGQVTTNEQFVTDAVFKSTSQLLDSLNFGAADFSLGQVEGIDELAVNGMRLALLKAGWINSNSAEDSLKGIYNIDISFSAFNFDYKKGKSRGFLKKAFIRREINGQVLIKISGPSYSYVGFREVSDIDTIAPDQANYVASLRYNQLSPSLPGAGLKRFLEPLAVTAAAGGLIYLFFANR